MSTKNINNLFSVKYQSFYYPRPLRSTLINIYYLLYAIMIITYHNNCKSVSQCKSSSHNVDSTRLLTKLCKHYDCPADTLLYCVVEVSKEIVLLHL